jgi:L-amino acid N-acyltransferase YncA
MPIEIRAATVEDAAGIQRIYAPIVATTAISFEDEPPEVGEMAARIVATLASHPCLVATRDHRVVGYAYAGPHRARAAYRFSADVTIYVAAEVHRTGIGRSLYAALFAELKRRGFHAAFAGIALPNPASVGLHEAMGFELIGVYREVGYKFWPSAKPVGLQGELGRRNYPRPSGAVAAASHARVSSLTSSIRVSRTSA